MLKDIMLLISQIILLSLATYSHLTNNNVEKLMIRCASPVHKSRI